MLDQEFSGFVNANRLQLYLERGGSGETVLYISGTGGDLRNKPNQFDSPLARYFNLVCYDQRGLGQSDKPDGEYTMADYADDAAAVLDLIGEESIRVVGVSFGGMVAQELALRYPRRIRSLLLLCTSSGGGGQPSYPLHELEALTPTERVHRHLQISDTRRDDAWVQAQPEQWQQLMDISLRARRPDRDEVGAMKQLNARKLHNTFDRLASLDMPVLLMGGLHDGIAPPQNMRALHAALPNAELRFYEGGHLFFIQDRQAYPDMLEWLASS
jgi:3-oxoadipate enol-lactonase